MLLALLPTHSPTHVRQSRIFQLAQFPAPQPTLPTYNHGYGYNYVYSRYFSWSHHCAQLADWQVLFPLARLWRDQPEATLQKPNHEPPVGIYVLAARGRTRDLPVLVSLLQRQTQQQQLLLGLESAGTFKALECLEQGNPTALKALLPPLILRISHGEADHNSVLVAQILGMAEKHGLALAPLAQALAERVKREKSARAACRWTRALARVLAQLAPEATRARRWARDLRILALSKSIVGGLTRKTKAQHQQRRWAWLGRSERVLEVLHHEPWRTELRHRKARLENRIARPRKARHRALVQ